MLSPAESSKDYHQRWYREHRNELSKNSREWRVANPEEVRRLYLKRRFRQYGTTEEWYDKTLREQDYKCALCGSADPKSNGNTFHIDHDHACCPKQCRACNNCRRGLLCSVCNTRLGILENAEWVAKANAYLARYTL